MKTVLLCAVLGVLLIVAVFGAVHVWEIIGDVELSGHGLIALALGILASLGLGVGLMFLVFYSSRHGHDDDVGG